MSKIGLSYLSAAAPREIDGKRLVDIRIMDTTENANKWRVTEEALEKCMQTLIGAPLLAYPDHTGTVAVGHFVSVSKPDGYIVGTAEITDPEAWERILRGEWRYVSPQIYATAREEDGVDVVEDFVLNHVAFVPNPAYENSRVLFASLPSFSAALTGILEEKKRMSLEAYVLAPEDREWDFNAADYTVEQLRRACAWFDRSKPDVKESYKLPHHLPDGTLVWRGVAAAMAALLGARGGVDIPMRDRREVYEHLVQHYKEFNKEPPEYHAELSVSQVTAVQPALEAGKHSERGEKEEMSQEIATLQVKVAELVDENKQLKAAVESLKAGLEALKAAMPKASAPKATMEAKAENIDDVVEQVRERLLGYRRGRDGKTVGGD